MNSSASTKLESLGFQRKYKTLKKKNLWLVFFFFDSYRYLSDLELHNEG
jgi:hypothetical protein